MQKRLNIINEVNQLNRVTQFVYELGGELLLAPDMISKLNLVLEEAVSNIIFYAYPNEKEKNICIDAEYNSSAIIFTLTDYGIAFDPLQVPDADTNLSADKRNIGGLGIYLIKQIMDDVKYMRIDNKNILVLKKVL